jgi:hypothetical protein
MIKTKKILRGWRRLVQASRLRSQAALPSC